jgi:hypothetical protein
MCILFKIFPLEITLLFTISRALVVVGSVWCLEARAALGADFITRLPRTRLEGLLPAASLQLGPVDPGCKE